MDKKLEREKIILFWLGHEKSRISNRDFFYLMENHGKIRFKTQNECDNTLVLLIKKNMINPKRICPDNGIYKPNKSLEKLLK